MRKARERERVFGADNSLPSPRESRPFIVRRKRAVKVPRRLPAATSALRCEKRALYLVRPRPRRRAEGRLVYRRRDPGGKNHRRAVWPLRNFHLKQCRCIFGPPQGYPYRRHKSFSPMKKRRVLRTQELRHVDQEAPIIQREMKSLPLPLSLVGGTKCFGYAATFRGRSGTKIAVIDT